MDDHTSSVLVELLDDETRFSYQNMLIETDDEVYTLKLDTLYEWWWQIEGCCFIPDPDDYDGDE